MRATLPLLLLTIATPAGAQIWDGGRSAIREVPAAPTTIEHDLHDIDHHYLQNYNTGSPQSATSAVRATAARVSLIYDRFLHPASKETP